MVASARDAQKADTIFEELGLRVGYQADKSKVSKDDTGMKCTCDGCCLSVLGQRCKVGTEDAILSRLL